MPNTAKGCHPILAYLGVFGLTCIHALDWTQKCDATHAAVRFSVCICAPMTGALGCPPAKNAISWALVSSSQQGGRQPWGRGVVAFFGHLLPPGFKHCQLTAVMHLRCLHCWVGKGGELLQIPPKASPEHTSHVVLEGCLCQILAAYRRVVLSVLRVTSSKNKDLGR